MPKRLSRWYQKAKSKVLRRKPRPVNRRIVIQIRWTSHTNEWDVVENLRSILDDNDFRFYVSDKI